MNNFLFENKTKVYFGKGGVKEYLGCLLEHYGDTVMPAYGGGSIKHNGVYDEIVGILNAEGKRIVEFPGIMPNPTYAKVQEGAKLARENHVDLILAVGGGSVSGTLSSSGAGTGGSCARYRVPSCLRLPMEAINSSSSMPSVFTFLLPMLIEV